MHTVGTVSYPAGRGQSSRARCVRRWLGTCVLCILGIIAGGWQLAGAATEEPRLQFLTAAPLALTAKEGAAGVPATVTVRNGGEEIADLTFYIVFDDDRAPREGKQIGVPATVEAYRARTFSLTLDAPKSGERVAGWIIATSTSSKVPPATLAFTITPERTGPLYVPLLVGWPLDLTIMLNALILALLSVGACWLRAGSDQRLTLPLYLEKLKWDPKESWLSNVTALGGVLGLVSGVALGPTLAGLHFADAGQYATLAVVFGVLGLIAPLPYAVSASIKPVQGSAPTNKALTGYLWGLLLTTAITLLSVLGQIWLAIALLSEVQRAGLLAAPIVIALVAMIAIVTLVLLFVYAPHTLRDQIDSGSKPPTEAEQTKLWDGVAEERIFPGRRARLL